MIVLEEVNVFEGSEYFGSGPGTDKFAAKIGPRTVGVYGDLQTAIVNRTKALRERAEASRRKKREYYAKKAGNSTTPNESRESIETTR